MSSTPFRWLTRELDNRAGDRILELLSVSSSRGVVPRSSITDAVARADDLSNYKVCAPGDVVLNRMSAYQGALGIAKQDGIVSPDYAVLRPVGPISPSYLAYVMRSSWFVGQMTARLRGIGSPGSGGVRTPRVNVDGLGDIPVRTPPIDEQRRIADFLDDRVARIDQIITSRREQSVLVRAHKESALEELVQSAGGERRPLQTLTDPRRPIQYGIVLPGPDFEGGVPIIKGGDIGSGRLGRLELNRTDPEIERAYVRSRVHPGDLVIAIRGSVGEVGVVPDSLRLANLTQDSARIAAFDCDMAWLRAVVESPGVQALMGARVTGSTVKGINIEDLRKVPVRVPSLRSQREVGAKADGLRVAAEAHVTGLHRSLALMQEYRQSLITAAVTGEIDVTTAGSGIQG